MSYNENDNAHKDKSMQHNIYLVSSYEIGDTSAEVIFAETDLNVAVADIVDNRCDWIETIYTHAIVWHITGGYLPVYEIVGVYRVNDGQWIDYDISSNDDGIVSLHFDGNELMLNKPNSKSQPCIISEYSKQRML